MKISNELKVGLLAVAAIFILIIGFNFLKGQSVFSKPFILYARFPNIGSLEKSNLVKINGLDVGTVHNFVPADKEVTALLLNCILKKALPFRNNPWPLLMVLYWARHISILKEAREQGTLKRRFPFYPCRYEPFQRS
jgi:hypothetical protein